MYACMIHKITAPITHFPGKTKGNEWLLHSIVSINVHPFSLHATSSSVLYWQTRIINGFTALSVFVKPASRPDWMCWLAGSDFYIKLLGWSQNKGNTEENCKQIILWFFFILSKTFLYYTLYYSDKVLKSSIFKDLKPKQRVKLKFPQFPTR